MSSRENRGVLILKHKQSSSISDEHRVYATVLAYASMIGFALLFITAVIYFFGILPPSVPLEEIHKSWSLSLQEYQERQRPLAPWEWVMLISKADYLAYVPVAFLGMTTVIGYIWIFPIFLKKKKYIYLGIVCAELIVLILSITGLVGR